MFANYRVYQDIIEQFSLNTRWNVDSSAVNLIPVGVVLGIIGGLQHMKNVWIMLQLFEGSIKFPWLWKRSTSTGSMLTFVAVLTDSTVNKYFIILTINSANIYMYR